MGNPPPDELVIEGYQEKGRFLLVGYTMDVAPVALVPPDLLVDAPPRTRVSSELGTEKSRVPRDPRRCGQDLQQDKTRATRTAVVKERWGFDRAASEGGPVNRRRRRLP
jgi:hypothetical protein